MCPMFPCRQSCMLAANPRRSGGARRAAGSGQPLCITPPCTHSPDARLPRGRPGLVLVQTVPLSSGVGSMCRRRVTVGRAPGARQPVRTCPRTRPVLQTQRFLTVPCLSDPDGNGQRPRLFLTVHAAIPSSFFTSVSFISCPRSSSLV